jgi:cytochrome-b5 reductase
MLISTAAAIGFLLVCAGIAVAVAFRRRAFLNPDRFKSSRLIEKETINYNTSRFRFDLAGHTVLGLPVGQHISFKFEDEHGKEVMRSYTPVTGDEAAGYVDFIIKVYAQGKMSRHVDSLSIGDHILMRGPKGALKYTQNMKRSLGACEPCFEIQVNNDTCACTAINCPDVEAKMNYLLEDLSSVCSL